MLLPMDQLTDKSYRVLLHRARTRQEHFCPTQMLIDGKPYRLERKRRGVNQARLARDGFETEMAKDETGILAVHVKIPLAAHGTDYLGMDPVTGEIGCMLCSKTSE